MTNFAKFLREESGATAIEYGLIVAGEQEAIVGHDPWEYGPTERNLRNMDAIAGYCHEQGLSRKKFSFADLFTSVFQGRKRGDEFRF